MSGARSISVIVNTFNRADSLRLTLDALGRLDYELFEVIVVDGPSTDHTQQVLQELSTSLKVERCPERNLSASRNVGIRAAAGEIVAFIDDDAYPDPGWLDALVDAFEDPEVAAAGGPVYNYTGAQIQAWRSFVDRLGNAWPEHDPYARRDLYLSRPYSEMIPYTIGTNASFRRSVIVGLGGFDEEFEYYLEESDLSCRIIDAGYVVRQLDDGFVYHKFLPSWMRERPDVVKDYFDVLKSKFYFALKHGVPQHSYAEVWRDAERFVESCEADVAKAVDMGLLSSEDRAKFDIDVHQASTSALQAICRSRGRTRPSAWFETRPRVFLPFPRLLLSEQKLHVCLVSQEYPPKRVNGIGRVVHSLATGLARIGHHVEVVTKGEDFLRVDLEEGVWVHRAPIVNQPGAPSGVPQHLWNYSASIRGEVDRIHQHRAIDVLQVPNWDSEGVAFAGDQRFAVVIGLYTPLHTLTLVDPHFAGALDKDPTLRQMLVLEADLYERADGLLACGPAIVKEIEHAYGLDLPANRVGLVPHGLPDRSVASAVDSEPPLESSNVDDEVGSGVLFVGRLEPRKGIDVLLAAAEQVLPTHPEVVFTIAGDDTIPATGGSTIRASFEQSASELVRERVRFLGPVDDETLMGLYARCDLVVVPSRFESFGLMLLEAMMFAKPVVASAVGGMQEIVAGGETGLLVPPGDVGALAKGLESLLDAPHLRSIMGGAGRARFIDRYSQAAMAEGAIAFYRSLMGQLQRRKIQ